MLPVPTAPKSRPVTADVSFEVADDGFSLVLYHDGLDDDAPTDIRETVTVSGAVLTREKTVRPAGSDAAYDFRNRVSMTREMAAETVSEPAGG